MNQAPPRLRSYYVVGWAAVNWPVAKTTRLALTRPENIQAVSTLAAAQTYARLHQIKENWWNDGTTKPRICIRVEVAR